MNTFSLKIIASDKVFYDGRCGIVIVPALDGEKAIMAHHENMVIATKVGEVRFKADENEEWRCPRQTSLRACPGAAPPEAEHPGILRFQGLPGKGNGAFEGIGEV